MMKILKKLFKNLLALLKSFGTFVLNYLTITVGLFLMTGAYILISLVDILVYIIWMFVMGIEFLILKAMFPKVEVPESRETNIITTSNKLYKRSFTRSWAEGIKKVVDEIYKMTNSYG